MKSKNIKNKIFAKNLRINVLKMIINGRSSHIASVYSCVEILTILFREFLKLNIKNYKNNIRNKLILSKGHAGAGLYAGLSEIGIVKKKNLLSHCKNNSYMSGHVSSSVPGVDFSSGSLGQGLGYGAGQALFFKKKNLSEKVFVILSDGELNEGSTWESLLFISHHKLNNLIIILDRNFYQSIKKTEETLALEPLKNKLNSFGFCTLEGDGHDFNFLRKALKTKSNKPKFIIANTIKGKGVDYMENNISWHYKFPNIIESESAISQIIKNK